MLINIKKNLHLIKKNLLFDKGIIEGKIVSFDDSLYNEMNNTFFNCIPISMHIKYLRPTRVNEIGKCYDRSLLMFFCFDDALLVRGDSKDYQLRYGKENGGHGWIEIGDYVYEPVLLLRFDRDLYYKIYGITNTCKATKDDYIKSTGDYYYKVKSVKISDFQPGGSKRTDLCVSIPLIREIAEYSGDDNFKRELNEYLDLIKYDEKQVFDELSNEVKSLLYTK